jgi:hypothetical protein
MPFSFIKFYASLDPRQRLCAGAPASKPSTLIDIPRPIAVRRQRPRIGDCRSAAIFAVVAGLQACSKPPACPGDGTRVDQTTGGHLSGAGLLGGRQRNPPAPPVSHPQRRRPNPPHRRLRRAGAGKALVQVRQIPRPSAPSAPSAPAAGSQRRAASRADPGSLPTAAAPHQHRARAAPRFG